MTCEISHREYRSGLLPRGFLKQGTTVLQLLDEGWAFDLYSFEVTVNGLKYRPAPFNCSWWHKCLNSNIHCRTDYIKNINRYFPQGDKPAQILHWKGAGCWHCGKVLPMKYVRLFQAFFLSNRLNHGREPVKILK